MAYFPDPITGGNMERRTKTLDVDLPLKECQVIKVDGVNYEVRQIDGDTYHLSNSAVPQN